MPGKNRRKKSSSGKSGKPANAVHGNQAHKPVKDVDGVPIKPANGGIQAGNGGQKPPAPVFSWKGRGSGDVFPIDESVKSIETHPVKHIAEQQSVNREINPVHQPAGFLDTKFKRDFATRIFSKNTVFFGLFAIVPVLGAAASVKTGLLLSAAMLIVLPVLNATMYFLYGRLPKNIRMAVTAVVSAVIVTPVCLLCSAIAPNVTGLSGIYLPLLAICVLPMIEKRFHGSPYGFAETLLAAFADALGFAFAVLLLSFAREILGGGTLYDRQLPGLFQAKLGFILSPPGALLSFALAIAVFKKVTGKNGGGRNE